MFVIPAELAPWLRSLTERKVRPTGREWVSSRREGHMEQQQGQRGSERRSQGTARTGRPAGASSLPSDARMAAEAGGEVEAG